MNLSNISRTHIEIIESNKDFYSFYIKNNLVLSKIVGEFDSNLKEIENLTTTKINLRGNLMVVRGEEINRQKVLKIIDNLILRYLNNNSIEKEDIKVIYDVTKMLKSENVANLADSNVSIKTPKKIILARSEKQKIYIEALRNRKIIFASGPAGTGKTFLAVAMALAFLHEEKVKRIILSRPAVEAGESLGFLPGDMKEKVDPYLIPIYDALHEFLGYEKMPLAFMRGRTLKDSFIILDEAQNATFTQIKMFITRLGNNSTMVLAGDPSQIDLNRAKESGFYETLKILEKLEDIKSIEFDTIDVMRNPLVSKIVGAYKKHNSNSDNNKSKF